MLGGAHSDCMTMPVECALMVKASGSCHHSYCSPHLSLRTGSENTTPSFSAHDRPGRVMRCRGNPQGPPGR